MTSDFSFEPASGPSPAPRQALQVAPFRVPVPPHPGQSPVSPDITGIYVLIPAFSFRELHGDD